MSVKENIKKAMRGWIPKEPSMPRSNINAVKAPTISENDKVYKLKVAAVFLGVLGVLFGWSAAGFAYIYFVENGVTSANATVYSIILWIFVIGFFWLSALIAGIKAKKNTAIHH